MNGGPTHRIVVQPAVVVEHLDLDRFEWIFYRKAESLVPLWTQVLEDRPTLVVLLAGDTKTDVRVTGSFETDAYLV